MTSLLDFLPRAQALEDLQDLAALKASAADLLEDLLGHLLLAEGPPPEPVKGYSADYRTAFVRSPTNRALCVAHTWTTGPWRCLLLETPSVPMGRPIFLANEDPESTAPPRTITDSRSQTFQRRIVFACQQFGIHQPVGEGAVHIVNGSHRAFLAWRHREGDESFNRALRGDSDNLAKNVLDGLQSAGALPNDRGVFRLTSTKELPAAWTDPPPSLAEAIHQEAHLRHGRGEALETIRVDLHLSKAHMGRIFPDYTTRSAARPRSPEEIQEAQALDAGRARQAADQILQEHLSYREAREKAGCSAQALQAALASSLRPTILQAKTSLPQLAALLMVDARTAGKLFLGDPEAQKALKKAAKASRHPKGSEGRAQAAKALDKALKALLEGPEPRPSIPEAAARFGANPGSLRSRLERLHEQAQAQPKGQAKGKAKAKAQPKAKARAKAKVRRKA